MLKLQGDMSWNGSYHSVTDQVEVGAGACRFNGMGVTRRATQSCWYTWPGCATIARVRSMRSRLLMPSSHRQRNILPALLLLISSAHIIIYHNPVIPCLDVLVDAAPSIVNALRNTES